MPFLTTLCLKFFRSFCLNSYNNFDIFIILIQFSINPSRVPTLDPPRPSFGSRPEVGNHRSKLTIKQIYCCATHSYTFQCTCVLTQARPRYHFCCGNTISITYSECALAAIGVQHSMRLLHIFICGLPCCAIFFHIISCWKKTIEHKMCICVF